MRFRKPDIVPAKNIPQHVAIIMDGNGRWAKGHHFGRVSGHRRGAAVVRNIVSAAQSMGVRFLTLYAFSEENWARPSLEVRALMNLLEKFLVHEQDRLIRGNIRLRSIGDLRKLPRSVQETLRQTQELTKNHGGMTLILALSYGGRDELTRAVVKISKKVAQGKMDPVDITEAVISDHLDTKGLPDPDLLIRTSGEYRISNFLPWQLIYTEFYITPTLWPDFTKDEFSRAVSAYSSRERRFGLVSEQLPEPPEEQCHNGR